MKRTNQVIPDTVWSQDQTGHTSKLVKHSDFLRSFASYISGTESPCVSINTPKKLLEVLKFMMRI